MFFEFYKISEMLLVRLTKTHRILRVVVTSESRDIIRSTLFQKTRVQGDTLIFKVTDSTLKPNIQYSAFVVSAILERGTFSSLTFIKH